MSGDFRGGVLLEQGPLLFELLQHRGVRNPGHPTVHNRDRSAGEQLFWVNGDSSSFACNLGSSTLSCAIYCCLMSMSFLLYPTPAPHTMHPSLPPFPGQIMMGSAMGAYRPMAVSNALLYASIISSTDPVAVLAQFQVGVFPSLPSHTPHTAPVHVISRVLSVW
jgi:hypothetical protein